MSERSERGPADRATAREPGGDGVPERSDGTTSQWGRSPHGERA